MTEVTPQTIVEALLAKGNEILMHAQECYIFRASVAYISQQVQVVMEAIRPQTARTDTQMQGLRHLYELFVHFDGVLPHLSESKWIQPALNWPANYVHEYIDGFRKNMLEIIPSIGISITDIYDEQQDQVNKRADLQALRSSVQDLVAKISTTDLVGLQQKIEVKLDEIDELLPQESGRRQANLRRPSCERWPIIQMKRRVEELLAQFKSINIESEDLFMQGQIGAGGFGTVYKATRFSTSEVVAVKELRSDRITVGSWGSLYAEVETMAAVRHPFVLEMVGAHITEPYRIVTRFCPGKSLFDRLHRSCPGLPTLTATALTRIAYQVAVGMAHLHSLGIVHRDLKTLNILLDEEDDGCVADFGLSGMMKDNRELCGGVGTPHYTAPEVLAHTKYGPKVDSFSYGVVLWEMLMRKVPYGDMSHTAIYEHVVTRSWRLPVPNEAPAGLKKLISRCWSKNPNDRPEFSEIVTLFEKRKVAFPGSENLDFQAIKATRRCPSLNLDFALRVLRDPSDRHFSSIVFFICANIDEKLRARLRQENLMETLVNSRSSTDAVLLLASVLLHENEFESFLANGGLRMFKECVETTSDYHPMSTALRFALKVPRYELSQLKVFLPQLVSFMAKNTGVTHSHTLQFLTRFSGDELCEFKDQISKALLEAAAKVEDQPTFDAVVALFPLVRDKFNINQIRAFYRLLRCNFVVPPAFVSALIDANDTWCHSSLIFSILTATARSDITDVFLSFLHNCAKNEKEVFSQLYKIQNFFPTLQMLIESDRAKAPLFILFCIASIKDAAMKLSDHPVLLSLIQMKGYQIQRLQIFTSLCMQEEFCAETTHIDGIIHLMVASLSVKPLVAPAVRLLAAFSTHVVGCELISDKGVLELFTQLFLSSSSGDMAVSHAILRNVANHSCEIPQRSLIVSCLMQDMMYEADGTCEILDTLIALIETMPGSVQEHDLQRIVMKLLNPEQPVLVIHLALKLFKVCEVITLRNIYPQLLAATYSLLDNPALSYPEIIQDCLEVIAKIGRQWDISEFVAKIQLARFVDDVKALLPAGDPRGSVFQSCITRITT